MPDEYTSPTEIDPAPRSGDPAGDAANHGDESIEASAPQRTKAAPPLITAVEIENFKGIGRPVRIDLRPITLLFGRNSAGKSTVLHALCYAHEILSHRNVNARKTELGGDQVDLGGFRTFVHAHDLTRRVRLRFELDLAGRDLSALLRGTADDILSEDWQNPPWETAPTAKSGWLELVVAWNELNNQPILIAYEVGANGELVGRIRTSLSLISNVALMANLSHPSLTCSRLAGMNTMPGKDPLTYVPLTYFVGERKVEGASETSGSTLQGDCFSLPRQRSSMPDWGELLDITSSLNGHPHFPYFRYEVSTLLVGVGTLLRDELAQLRYLGPLRDLHPHDYVERGRPIPRRWANGSAAWDFLTNDAHNDSEVLRDTSDWLSRKERLDTGYELRAPSVVELPGDDPLVAKILMLKKMERLGVNPRDYGQEAPESPGDIVRDADPQQVVALADRIADARVRKDVQIVTTETELTVRTSDIGVGISQILPVVVAALDPKRPGVTAIEQPELHVHPKIQVELGDLFAQRIDQGGVFLIETHSEHLMLRLLRRIEETHGEELPEGKPPLKPDEVSVVFMEKVGSEVRAARLRIDETGEFKDRWPHGFFEERDDELF